ncbi:MAG: hypothetical protein ACPKMZ_01900 [Pleomorphochaeta sp.]
MTEIQVLIVGIVISLLNLYLYVYQINKDKGKLSFDFEMNRSTQIEEAYVLVFVFNIGRRPINVKSYGCSLKENEDKIISKKILSQIINPQDYFTFPIEFKDFKPGEIKNVFVIDQSGKKWMSKKKSMTAFSNFKG